MEVWILVNNRAGRQHARENGEQVRRVFALGGRPRPGGLHGHRGGRGRFSPAGRGGPAGFAGVLRRRRHLEPGAERLTTAGCQAAFGLCAHGHHQRLRRLAGPCPRSLPRRRSKSSTASRGCWDLGRFGEREFLYVASFGAFTQSSYKAAPQVKAVLGHLAYVLESAKELPFLRACSLQVDTGDALYEGEYLFGAVSNTLSVGGVLKLDPPGRTPG